MQHTNWLVWIIPAGALAAFLLLRRLALVPPRAARDWLRKGALVLDVRSEAEYQAGHLPRAINLPLGRLRQEIARRAPDKAQPLLLHCLSGGRSGLARALLKQMGYRHAFNLGSYRRARRILDRGDGE